jgi:hypothetical protein
MTLNDRRLTAKNLFVNFKILSHQSVIVHVIASKLPYLWVEDGSFSENINNLLEESLVFQ